MLEYKISWRCLLLEYANVRVHNITALLAFKVCECQSTEYHGATGYWSMSEYRISWCYWLLEYVRVQNIMALLVIGVCQSTEYQSTIGY